MIFNEKAKNSSPEWHKLRITRTKHIGFRIFIDKSWLLSLNTEKVIICSSTSRAAGTSERRCTWNIMLLILCPISELDVILKMNLTSQQELAIPFVFEKGVQVGRLKNMCTINIPFFLNIYKMCIFFTSSENCHVQDLGFTFRQVGEILVDGTRLSDWETWISWIWCFSIGTFYKMIHTYVF